MFCVIFSRTVADLSYIILYLHAAFADLSSAVKYIFFKEIMRGILCPVTPVNSYGYVNLQKMHQHTIRASLGTLLSCDKIVCSQCELFFVVVVVVPLLPAVTVATLLCSPLAGSV